MQRVRLLGELGELFGEEHTYYNLRHPADAIKLLCINKPAFKDYLLKSEENGIGFKVIQADAEMGYEDLLLPLGQRELVVTPVITGSGGTTGKILAGVGLIAFSIITAGAGAGFLGLGAGLTGTAAVAATATTAAVAGTGFVLGTAASVAIGSIGAALVLGGVAEMISPQPKIPSNFGAFGGGSRFGSSNRTNGPVGVTRGLDGQQSYAYTGAANTVGIGATVPLAYGKVLIGSHLLRAKVSVKDESDPALASIKKPGPETFLIGGEKITTIFSDVSGAVVRKTKQANVAKFKSTLNPNKIENFNKEINLADNAVATQNILRATTGSHNKQFNVALKLVKGLFDYAGGVGTTLVDAFVTYEISVFKGQAKTDIGNLVAQDNATVQALMTASDAITWIHKMELPTANLGNSYWNVEIKIIDTNAADSTSKLSFIALGYTLLEV